MTNTKTTFVFTIFVFSILYFPGISLNVDAQAEMFLVCHQGKTLSASMEAYLKHLAHGDSPGSCETVDNDNDGTFADTDADDNDPCVPNPNHALCLAITD
ncbi:MAG: hypothetical protein OEM21_09965, partial [Nitrosopumilus sp.]|nr:hypothetical protein [Nitrosopumilus sp.]